MCYRSENMLFSRAPSDFLPRPPSKYPGDECEICFPQKASERKISTQPPPNSIPTRALARVLAYACDSDFLRKHLVRLLLPKPLQLSCRPASPRCLRMAAAPSRGSLS